MPTRLLTHSDRQRTKRRRIEGKGRRKTAARGYGGRWLRLRRMALNRHPMCEHPDCNEPATDVHHIRPLPAGDDSFENLQCLCHGHHSTITAAGWRRGSNNAR